MKKMYYQFWLCYLSQVLVLDVVMNLIQEIINWIITWIPYKVMSLSLLSVQRRME